MKKILLLIVVVVLSTMANAQDFLGFQLGYAQPTTRLNTAQQKNNLNTTEYNGLKLGLLYDATIINGFGVSMGLNYTFGANTSDWSSVGKLPYPKTRSKSFYHQLEIPVDWQYKFEIAQNTWVILYTGPTLQYGLDFSKRNFKDNGKEVVLENDQNLFSVDDMKDNALKRVNVTWGVGAGFQYERYFIRGGYDFGIINPYKAYQFDQVVGEGNPRTRGRFDQWQIKLGVYFWQSK
jgi:hypothetical protein